MHTYTVTITSKNQITLPAELVRNLKLSKGRTLQVSEKHGSIEMNVKPSLREVLQKYHKPSYQSAPLAAEDMGCAAGEIAARRFAEKFGTSNKSGDK